MSNNPDTWCSYDIAKERSSHFDGMGIMFSGGICGIDIDGADEHTKMNPLQAEVMELFKGTYTEFSPSGKGIHILFRCDRAKLPLQIDENGNFIGVYDFNLSGKDVLLNYLIREIGWQDDETELNIIKSAIDTVGKVYTFSALEKQAAPMLYRCIKPLWYTKIQRLKAAGDDQTAIQACLDKTESMLTKTINFFA